jgi:hypothetical protein
MERGAAVSARVLAAEDPAVVWGDAALGRYAAGVATLKAEDRLANATFEVAALQLKGRAFMLAAPDWRLSQAWPLSLRTLYGAVAREEAGRYASGIEAASYRAASLAMEGWLSATAADALVFVNHALMSTSLFGGWRGADLETVIAALAGAYPDRAIVFRSLTDWSDAELIARLRGLGARFIPNRAVYVVDDPARDWLAKRDTKHDLRQIEREGYTTETPERLDDTDLARAHALYRALYVAKHSAFNPDYTPALLRAATDSGFLRLHVLRNGEGRIDAFVGTIRAGDVLASPVLGYDLEVPQTVGLYRMAMALPGVEAAEAGLRVNHSAGAGTFKRVRGARPVLEQMAIVDSHLPLNRRIGYAGLTAALGAVTPSLMRIALR